MVPGISLANKCQLLFGFAALIIITVALSVPWFLTPAIVRESQFEHARQVADAWLSGAIRLGQFDTAGTGDDQAPNDVAEQYVRVNEQTFTIRLIGPGERTDDEKRNTFLESTLRRAADHLEVNEHTALIRRDARPVYHFARVIREWHLPDLPSEVREELSIAPFDDDLTSAPVAEGDAIVAVLLIEHRSLLAEGQLLRSRIFLVAIGIFATLTSILVFHFILTKLIFSPVRMLRETAEKVQEGQLAARSQIKTGDEFEQLSEAFNSMLDQVEQTQVQLRAMNESLDLKLSELAEANIGLYESNRLKSEFVANVSHELRTPLNSIIGFTELLVELAQNDPNADPKRQRYLANILSSGRSLLEMINELLDMAKIEAGRMEVNVEPTSVGDVIEGLVAIMRPQAEAKEIEIETRVSANVPVIETDPGKLQQILYNFLSNAIKFTPEGGRVAISAARVTRQDNSLGVRLSVTDTGPGIPEDMQDVIFEKFRQIDAGHTREHAGTGLGLAICRELAQMLGAEVSFVSEPGKGATFFVDLPQTHQPEEAQPLMP
jgi:two-component system, NarL family, sensor histidine kinase BarA